MLSNELLASLRWKPFWRWWEILTPVTSILLIFKQSSLRRCLRMGQVAKSQHFPLIICCKDQQFAISGHRQHAFGLQWPIISPATDYSCLLPRPLASSSVTKPKTVLWALCKITWQYLLKLNTHTHIWIMNKAALNILAHFLWTYEFLLGVWPRVETPQFSIFALGYRVNRS